MKLRFSKLGYSAMQPSRFRRERTGLGGTADAHYRNTYQFWRLRELARDMDRNDMIVSQMLDRAVNNIVGCGMRPVPQTTDAKLNKFLIEAWEDWSEDKQQVDLAWRHTFPNMERLLLRSMFLDGDVIVLPQHEVGQLQVIESEWLASPDSFGDTVHGVTVVPSTNRPIKYWFIKQMKDRRQVQARRVPFSLKSKDVVGVDAYTGNIPNVLHLFDPKRFTQSRGVTVLAPMFDLLGMFEDTNFARLVQQQVVSCIAAFVVRDRDYQWGARVEENEEDGSTTFLEEIDPGTIPYLRPGESIQTFNPNVPNPEFKPYAQFLLRLIGGNLGLPLEITIMDTSNTTFHGYRGALQQAYKGFKRLQKLFSQLFHREVWKFRIRYLASQGELGVVARRKLEQGREKEVFKHTWQPEGWPYVDPKKDVEADRLRIRSLLTSPQRVFAERGQRAEEIVAETVDFWASAVATAQSKVEELKKQHPDLELNYRDLLHDDFVERRTSESTKDGTSSGSSDVEPEDRER